VGVLYRVVWGVTCMLLAVALAGPASAAAATGATLDVTVTTDPDNGDGLCASGGSCSLREAINQADADSGDTIDIPPGTYTLNPGNGPLTVTANMTIAGTGSSGATFISGDATNGTGGTRVLTVKSPAVVTVNGVTIENGSVSGTGGGVLDSGGTLTLADDVVTDNSATAGGGGIEADGSVTLLGTTVAANSTGAAGGGIEAEDPGASGGALAITDSTISTNTATTNGGGIALQGETTSGTLAASINQSLIADNAAGQRGGGLIDSSGADPATLSLSDSTVAQNSAVTEGGGVYLGNGHTADTLTNDTIDANKTTGSSSTGGDVGVHSGGTKPSFINTIVAAGAVPSGGKGADCDGAVTSLGTNLDDLAADGCGFTAPGDIVGKDPDLGGLLDNGGPTSTIALLAGSPAVNAGNNMACPATDQRGVVRPQGGVCDIGAYEYAPPVVQSVGTADVTATTVTLGAEVSNPDVEDGTVTFEYGTTTSYGNTTISEAVDAGGTALGSIILSGLTPDTTYHFRVIAANPDATVDSPDETFTTAKSPPGSSRKTLSLSAIKVSRKGVLTTSISTAVAGGVTAKATFTMGKKTHTYGTERVKSKAASVARIKVSVSAATAKLLRRLGHATVTVTVTYRPIDGIPYTTSRTVKVKVTRRGRYS
jgi:fibronectin-binding autotransporter adhesin